MLKSIEIIDDIQDILDGQDAIVLDYNGVIFDPKTGETYKQADDLIKEAENRSIPVYILSNSTASSEGFVLNMTKLGYEKGKDYKDIITAGETFRTALTEDPKILKNEGIVFNNKKIYPIGHVFPAVLENTGFELTKSQEEADFAYIGIPQLTTDEYNLLSSKEKEGFSPSGIVSGNYDVLAKNEDAANLFYEQKMADLKLPVVNANQDITAGEIKPDGISVTLYRQGKFAKMHESNGNKIIKMGKPYPDIMKLSINKIRRDTNKLNPSVMFVGDNIGTDIKGVERLKQDASMKDAKIFCVLCLNSYWTENNRSVNNLIKMMKNSKIDKNLINLALKNRINKIGEEEGAIPNKIISWVSKKQRD